jgi:hypothetical protein
VETFSGIGRKREKTNFSIELRTSNLRNDNKNFKRETLQMYPKRNLNSLVDALLNIKKDSITSEHLWYVIQGALQPSLLINNLSEALRVTAKEIEELLTNNGFGDLVMQSRLKEKDILIDIQEEGSVQIYNAPSSTLSYLDLISITTTPPINYSIVLPNNKQQVFLEFIKNVIHTLGGDPFSELYRVGVKQYHDSFIKTDAKKIDNYIEHSFGAKNLKYLINTGIGADEQFNHFIAYCYNKGSSEKKYDWFIIDSPRQLNKLPSDATIQNALFMEFSRSGKTEETVKIHEYTPREAKRIVFANSGPLREIGIRDNNLIVQLPDQVSGRFGRNKTPILLAPMYVAKMDTEKFWQDIENAISTFNLTDTNNIPFQIARFIYIYQIKNGINQIYLGCNDDGLLMLADEFTQFWNEGVNKGENDILMSRYLGLPRDSHTNIEGILANCKTKMAIFLFTDKVASNNLHPLIKKEIDPINPNHKGLIYGDEEIILTEANFQRFSELMPCIKITIHGRPNLKHAAVLSQLWADITFCYSRLKNIDPGSNPEIKFVRDRAAQLLSEGATKVRSKLFKSQ